MNLSNKTILRYFVGRLFCVFSQFLLVGDVGDQASFFGLFPFAFFFLVVYLAVVVL